MDSAERHRLFLQPRLFSEERVLRQMLLPAVGRSNEPRSDEDENGGGTRWGGGGGDPMMALLLEPCPLFVVDGAID